MAEDNFDYIYDILADDEKPSSTDLLLKYSLSDGTRFFDVLETCDDLSLFLSQLESNQANFPSWNPNPEEADQIRKLSKRQKQKSGSGLAAASSSTNPPIDTMQDANTVEPVTAPVQRKWPRGQASTPRASDLSRGRDPKHPDTVSRRLTGFDPADSVPSTEYDPHAALRSLRFDIQGLDWPNEDYNTKNDELMAIPYDDPSLKITKTGGDVHVILSLFDIGKYEREQVLSATRGLNLPVNPTAANYRIGRQGDHFLSIPVPGLSSHLWKLFRTRVVQPAGVPMRISLGVHERSDTSALLHLELTPSTQALTKYPPNMWPLKIERLLKRMTGIPTIVQPRQLDWSMEVSLQHRRISVVCRTEADAASLMSNAALGVMFGTFVQSGSSTLRKDSEGRLVHEKSPGLFLVNIHGLQGVSYETARAHVARPSIAPILTGFRPFNDRRPGRNGVWNEVNIYQAGFDTREDQHKCIRDLDGSTFNGRSCHYTLPRPSGKSGSCFRCHKMGHRVFECTARVCGTCYENHESSQCPITHPFAPAPPPWQIAADTASSAVSTTTPGKPRRASQRTSQPATTRVLYDPKKRTRVRLTELASWTSGDEIDEDDL
jgi:hypothetical protein